MGRRSRTMTGRQGQVWYSCGCWSVKGSPARLSSSPAGLGACIWAGTGSGVCRTPCGSIWSSATHASGASDRSVAPECGHRQRSTRAG
ncbi:UNVERIFIED_CONTAM: hypothetical protein GTU68_066645 [Idotea baltica]|nr:hypothetical protein [Idotea baltica]